MAALYRSEDGRQLVQRWCVDRLAAWPVAHETQVVETSRGPTHVVAAGGGAAAGEPAVVYLPGTNFNAATSLQLLDVLAGRCRVFAVDLPGQPGLSTSERPADDPRVQGRWLSEVLRALPLDAGRPVVLVGHSRGAHIALCADPSLVDRLVLLNPAGLVTVVPGPAVLRNAIPWMVRPTPARSQALLRLMSAPGRAAERAQVSWLTLVATHCRTTGAPGPVPSWCTDRWRSRPVTVCAGEHDRFFPPGRVAGAARSRLGVEPVILSGVGHLSVEEDPEAVAAHVLGDHA